MVYIVYDPVQHAIDDRSKCLRILIFLCMKLYFQDGAKAYMRNHNVPIEMQRRVQRWYDYAWSRYVTYPLVCSESHRTYLFMYDAKFRPPLVPI